VLEIGCGWGDHLHNLHILSPKINLHGIDISEEQIRNLKKRHPKLIAKLSVIDITQPNCEIPKCDLVYSNAVLLHIKDELKFISALTNFFKASNDVVILKENWESHNFFEDIKKLFEEKSIPWKKIFFYYAELNEKSNIKIMIASKSKLNFPDLTDYKLLQN
jgi:trans-aconitate methyltransferase